MNACDKSKNTYIYFGEKMSDKLTTWNVELSELTGRPDARVKLGLRKLSFFCSFLDHLFPFLLGFFSMIGSFVARFSLYDDTW